MLVIYRLI